MTAHDTPPPAVPRYVHWPGGLYRLVKTDADLEQALKDGWALQPEKDWPVAEPREWDGVSPLPARHPHDATPTTHPHPADAHEPAKPATKK
jgi:hypothetical protein